MSFLKDTFDPPEVRQMMIEGNLKKLSKEKVKGLDEIIREFELLKEIGIYEDLKKAYPVKKIVDPVDEEIIAYNMPDNSVFMLASNYLSHTILNLPFSDLIKFTYIYHSYRLLGLLYYCKTQNTSDLEDFLQIHNSELDRNLILFQDNFDVNSNNVELSPKFFQNIRKVKWENNAVKKFFYRVEDLRNDIVYPTYEYIFKFGNLSTMENVFIQLIAASRAVKENREFITKKDIIIGYKTYIKLLKTDITKYRVRKNLEIKNDNDNGYLVCEKCNEYYKLQPGESSGDFSDKCECGGELKYYDNIDWLFNEKAK